MICPRCSFAEIAPETNRCVLCGYAAGWATAVAVGMEAPAPQVDLVTRGELEQLFHIERALDTGGFITVYLAREADTGRKVVLRVLPRQPVRDAALEDGLLREFATAASLDHPHIVPLFRYGATPRHLWFSGQHVPGQSLAELLSTSGPLELHPSLRLVEQVASALHYAHRRGIQHADVRPANVRVDPNGWALLTGFAVGRALDRLPLALLGGRPVRPAEFLAPEERHGRQGGPAADQYGLALLVYQSLTGSLPFDGMGVDDAVLAPPPHIPPNVQEGLRRALSPRPAERFQSIMEFMSALETEPAPRASPPQVRRPSGRELPAPPPPSPAPRRPSPAAGIALPPLAPARPSNNTPILLVDGPSRWRPALRWIVPAALVVAGGAYGPAVVRQIRSTSPAEGAPAPASPPFQVPLDSGFDARLAPQPVTPGPKTPQQARPVPAAPTAPTRSAPPRVTVATPRPGPVATPARLFVNSTPWGQVSIDGHLVGNTPQANLAVTAGQHSIRITREGFEPFERVVQLAPGQVLRVTDVVLRAVP